MSDCYSPVQLPYQLPAVTYSIACHLFNLSKSVLFAVVVFNFLEPFCIYEKNRNLEQTYVGRYYGESPALSNTYVAATPQSCTLIVNYLTGDLGLLLN